MNDAATQFAVSLYNDAMDELGTRRIDSFEDETPGAAKALRSYNKVIGFMLGICEWTWQLGRVQLSQLTDPPESGFGFVFDIPANATLRALYDEKDGQHPYKMFRLMGGKVHADCDTLYADVRSNDPHFAPELWSNPFRMAAIKALAADRCLQLGKTRSLRQDLTTEALGDPGTYPKGGLIAIAANEDGQQHPGGRLVLADGPLIDARRGLSRDYDEDGGIYW